MTTETRFVGVPEPILRAALADLTEWRVLGERMLALSIATCPVSRTEDQGGGSGSSSGSLKESMKSRYEYGPDPRIMIGSELTRGDSHVSALGVVEMGTDAHSIDPVNAKALRFTSGGGVVFAGHVDHPGTKPNPFVERAMRTVILESVAL